MNILSLFRQQSRTIIAFVVILGMANSVLNGSMLAFINSGITQKPLPFLPQYDWVVFVAMLVLSFIGSRVFQRHMIRMTNEIAFKFESHVIERLRFASQQSIEKLGPERVYTAIGDTRVLAQIPQVFVTFLNAAIMVICVIIYMFLQSPPGALGVLALMIGLAAFYLVKNKRIEKDLNTARDMQNEYYRYLTDFLAGFREIKMSTARNENIYHNFLRRVLHGSKEINIRTADQYVRNEMIGSYSWYIVLGAILFVMPHLFHFSPAQVASFMVTVLFVVGPVGALIGVIPTYTRSKIAVERLNRLDAEINARLAGDEKPSLGAEDAEPFRQIEFREVGYQYFDKDNRPAFRLADVDLKVRRGEVVFVTGGNGSGKSTFVNLLTGLYKPDSGAIVLNGRPVGPDAYPAFRDRISAIFTNHYLFRENYDGFDLSEDNQQLSELLAQFQLRSVARFDSRSRLIDKNLSKGEQKRLAMIYLLLENKDIVVLDEWAAEQDPGFRAFFYKKLLPQLKLKGKTIIAVTHDDAYFDCADRIIKFDFGRIVADARPKAVETLL